MTPPQGTPGQWPVPKTKLGDVERIAFFRRIDYTENPGDLAYVSMLTFGLGDWTWESGPDYGIATVTQPSGQRITCLSYDLDFLAMMESYVNGGGEPVEIPADAFAFYMQGWPEDWPNSGLEATE